MIRGQRRISILVDPSQLDAIAGNGREMARVILSRIAWLTEKIQDRAASGLPVNIFRLERKSLRWALERAGLELRDNPPIPEREAVVDAADLEAARKSGCEGGDSVPHEEVAARLLAESGPA